MLYSLWSLCLERLYNSVYSTPHTIAGHVVAKVDFDVLQEVGASHGLTALHGKAAQWSSLFCCPPIKEVLPAICGLIRPPLGGPEVAQMFGPQLMAAIGRAILAGDALEQQLGMPLLVELCTALKPEGSKAGLPVILTAEQAGVQLAAYINSIVTKWPNLPPASSSSSAASKAMVQASERGFSLEEAADQRAGNNSVAAAWVAVLCLPNANSNPGQIVTLLQGLIKKTASVLEECSTRRGAELAQGNVVEQAEVLFLQCYARGMLALVLAAHHPAQLSQHLEATLQLLEQHPREFHVVRCAAEVASVVTKGGKKLPVEQLQVQTIKGTAVLTYISTGSTGLTGCVILCPTSPVPVAWTFP